MNDLSSIANSHQPLPTRFSRGTDGFSRHQVVEAFQRAFDMIGGIERLTLWAHENPGDFFRLYAKLLPATTVALGQGTSITIEHTIPRGALDNHQAIDAAILEMTPADQIRMLADASN